MKTKIETKAEMKVRTNGKSPDEGDSAMILVELCRRRFGFTPGGIAGARTKVKDVWKQKVLRTNGIFDSNSLYQPEEMVAV